MKKKNPILKWFLVLMLLMLVIELIFNFSGILEENFATTVETVNDDGIDTSKHIQSIVAKYSGKIINVKALGSPPTNKVLIHFYGNSSLTVNDDGTYSVGLSDEDSIRQQWNIVYIDEEEKYDTHISTVNKNSGYSLDKVDYPFYLIISAHKPDRCLQYDAGSVLVRPIANYDSQKWDISYEKVESNNSIKTHKYSPMSLLSSEFRTDPSAIGEGKNDNIKINLNLDNTAFSSILEKYKHNNPLLGSNQNGTQVNDLDEDCPTCN